MNTKGKGIEATNPHFTQEGPVNIAQGILPFQLVSDSSKASVESFGGFWPWSLCPYSAAVAICQSQSCLPVIDPTGQENFGNFFWIFSLCGHAYRNLQNSKFSNIREIRSFRRLEGSKEYFSFFRQARNEQLKPRN
jgi:hypothetical protein